MIRTPEVRLVGEKGEQLGVMPLYQAREMAEKQGLDIVEVAPQGIPPVCRLLNYGKFKYEQEKKEQEARKHQKIALLREIRIRPKIGDHDFNAKARSVQKLIGEGNKVKVTVMFRGREITHPELGYKLLKRMVEAAKETAGIERPPVMDGRRVDVILAPLAAQKVKPKVEPKPRVETAPKEEVKKA
jgi:translation initiation factor IF-3